MRDFVLNVQDIETAGKAYAFPIGASWMKEALDGLADLTVDSDHAEGTVEVEARRSGTDILVQGRVHAWLQATCSRCLGPAHIEVDASITSLFSARSAAAGGAKSRSSDVELSAEDLDRDYYSGDEIVLDEIVRQHVLLECPMQPLCGDDCGGIVVPAHVRPPAAHREGQPSDPRLAPLMKLARELARDEE